MRGFAVVGLALVAACAPQDMAPGKADPAAYAGNETTQVGEGGTHACDANRTSGLLGKLADGPLRTEALRRTGARRVRLIPPDTHVTMDYWPDRLNIHTDAAGRATRFSCG